MKIIMDSLVPNHKKKQLMPERIMEPPDGCTEGRAAGNEPIQFLRHHAKFLFDAFRFLPNMDRRPILSMRRADTMLPGSTARVPKKLMK